MLIKVKVRTGAKKFSAKMKDGVLLVSVKEQPENNRANTELVRNLSKMLGPCRIVKGFRSKNKIIEVKNLDSKNLNI